MRWVRISILCLLILGIISVNAGAVSYIAHDLNPSGASSTANRINDLQQIVGSLSDASGLHSVIWNGNGSYNILPSGVEVDDINNTGQAVGKLNGQPVIWDSNGNVTALPYPANAHNIITSSISDTGWIAGSFTPDNSFLSCAIIWKPDLTTNIIGGPSNFYDTYTAVAVNNSGGAVGTSTHSMAPSAAVYYYPDGGVKFVADGIFGDPSAAYGINDLGQIVGRESNQAAIWNPDGTTILLGYGIAYNINDAGQVVGKSSDWAAFWDASGVQIGLPMISGAVSSEAYDINELGWIVGKSVDASGISHATLWEPIIVAEPSTLLYTIICSIGGIGMLLRRRS